MKYPSHFTWKVSRRLYSSHREIIAQCEEIWKTGKTPEKFNFSTDIFDKHAKCNPSSTALWFDNDQNEERKWSFSELQTESIRSAIFLRNFLRLPNASNPPQKSPFILTILPRIPEWWFLHLGAIRMGSVFCPGTTMLTSEDIQYRLEASAARMIITDDDNLAKVEEAYQGLVNSNTSKNLRKVVISKKSGNLPKGWIDYRSTVSKDITDADVLEFKNSETLSEDCSQAYFTSGTTGKPKMVAHTHASYGIGHFSTSRLLDLKDSKDLVWNLSDPGWAKASYSSFFAPWIVGSCIFIHQMERFEAKKILKALSKQPISVFCAPPTAYRSLLQEPFEGFKFPKLRHCVGGGEAVNPEILRAWKEKAGLTIKEGYGQTEMTAIDNQLSQREGSLGKPNQEYFNVRIVDENAKECPTGTEGKVAIKIKPKRPIGLFKGYLKSGINGPEMDDEKNASCFIGDYYLMGDQAYFDESGHLFFVGRADDVINSAGYRIGPFEIESVLQTHPAVVESAVVPSPDPQRGEVVKAFIILAEKYRSVDKEKLAKEIQNYVKQQTAPYKYPKKLEFVESLPKTVSGKILRRELKQQEFKRVKKDLR